MIKGEADCTNKKLEKLSKKHLTCAPSRVIMTFRMNHSAKVALAISCELQATNNKQQAQHLWR